MQWWTRRFNQMLAGGLSVALLLACVAGAGSAALAPMALVFVPVFWIYLVSIVLLVEWALLARRRSHPELPIGPPAWNGRRGTLYVLVAIVVVVTLLREGAFAPRFTYVFNRYTSERTHHFDTHTGGTTTAVGDAAPTKLAGHYVECNVSCSPLGNLCDAFRSRFKCDNDHPDRPVRTPPVTVFGSVSFGSDPFCYTPLYKSGATDIHATLNIGVSAPEGTASHSFTLTGNITQSMSGIASCYTFSRLLGEEGANILANAVNQYIQAN